MIKQYRVATIDRNDFEYFMNSYVVQGWNVEHIFEGGPHKIPVLLYKRVKERDHVLNYPTAREQI